MLRSHALLAKASRCHRVVCVGDRSHATFAKVCTTSPIFLVRELALEYFVLLYCARLLFGD